MKDLTIPINIYAKNNTQTPVLYGKGELIINKLIFLQKEIQLKKNISITPVQKLKSTKMSSSVLNSIKLCLQIAISYTNDEVNESYTSQRLSTRNLSNENIKDSFMNSTVQTPLKHNNTMIEPKVKKDSITSLNNNPKAQINNNKSLINEINQNLNSSSQKALDRLTSTMSNSSNKNKNEKYKSMLNAENKESKKMSLQNTQTIQNSNFNISTSKPNESQNKSMNKSTTINNSSAERESKKTNQRAFSIGFSPIVNEINDTKKSIDLEDHDDDNDNDDKNINENILDTEEQHPVTMLKIEKKHMNRKYNKKEAISKLEHEKDVLEDKLKMLQELLEQERRRKTEMFTAEIGGSILETLKKMENPNENTNSTNVNSVKINKNNTIDKYTSKLIEEEGILENNFSQEDSEVEKFNKEDLLSPINPIRVADKKDKKDKKSYIDKSPNREQTLREIKMGSPSKVIKESEQRQNPQNYPSPNNKKSYVDKSPNRERILNDIHANTIKLSERSDDNLESSLEVDVDENDSPIKSNKNINNNINNNNNNYYSSSPKKPVNAVNSMNTVNVNNRKSYLVQPNREKILADAKYNNNSYKNNDNYIEEENDENDLVESINIKKVNKVITKNEMNSPIKQNVNNRKTFVGSEPNREKILSDNQNNNPNFVDEDEEMEIANLSKRGNNKSVNNSPYRQSPLRQNPSRQSPLRQSPSRQTQNVNNRKTYIGAEPNREKILQDNKNYINDEVEVSEEETTTTNIKNNNVSVNTNKKIVNNINNNSDTNNNQNLITNSPSKQINSRKTYVGTDPNREKILNDNHQVINNNNNYNNDDQEVIENINNSPTKQNVNIRKTYIGAEPNRDKILQDNQNYINDEESEDNIINTYNNTGHNETSNNYNKNINKISKVNNQITNSPTKQNINNRKTYVGTDPNREKILKDNQYIDSYEYKDGNTYNSKNVNIKRNTNNNSDTNNNQNLITNSPTKQIVNNRKTYVGTDPNREKILNDNHQVINNNNNYNNDDQEVIENINKSKDVRNSPTKQNVNNRKTYIGVEPNRDKILQDNQNYINDEEETENINDKNQFINVSKQSNRKTYVESSPNREKILKNYQNNINNQNNYNEVEEYENPLQNINKNNRKTYTDVEPNRQKIIDDSYKHKVNLDEEDNLEAAEDDLEVKAVNNRNNYVRPSNSAFVPTKPKSNKKGSNFATEPIIEPTNIVKVSNNNQYKNEYSSSNNEYNDYNDIDYDESLNSNNIDENNMNTSNNNVNTNHKLNNNTNFINANNKVYKSSTTISNPTKNDNQVRKSYIAPQPNREKILDSHKQQNYLNKIPESEMNENDNNISFDEERMIKEESAKMKRLSQNNNNTNINNKVTRSKESPLKKSQTQRDIETENQIIDQINLDNEYYSESNENKHISNTKTKNRQHKEKELINENKNTNIINNTYNRNNSNTNKVRTSSVKEISNTNANSHSNITTNKQRNSNSVNRQKSMTEIENDKKLINLSPIRSLYTMADIERDKKILLNSKKSMINNPNNKNLYKSLDEKELKKIIEEKRHSTEIYNKIMKDVELYNQMNKSSLIVPPKKRDSNSNNINNNTNNTNTNYNVRNSNKFEDTNNIITENTEYTNTNEDDYKNYINGNGNKKQSMANTINNLGKNLLDQQELRDSSKGKKSMFVPANKTILDILDSKNNKKVEQQKVDKVENKRMSSSVTNTTNTNVNAQTYEDNQIEELNINRDKKSTNERNNSKLLMNTVNSTISNNNYENPKGKKSMLVNPNNKNYYGNFDEKLNNKRNERPEPNFDVEDDDEEDELREAIENEKAKNTKYNKQYTKMYVDDKKDKKNINVKFGEQVQSEVTTKDSRELNLNKNGPRPSSLKQPQAQFQPQPKAQTLSQLQNQNLTKQDDNETKNNLSDSYEDSILNKSFKYNNIEEFLKDFNNFFHEDLVEHFPDDNPEPLKHELLKLLEKLFELQQIYYKDFDKIRSHYKKLKQLLNDYSSKFLAINTNYRKHAEEMEACKLNRVYEDFNHFEVETIKENIKVGLTNCDIIKQFFKDKYKKQLNIPDKKLLLKSLGFLYKNHIHSGKVAKDNLVKSEKILLRNGYKIEVSKKKEIMLEEPKEQNKNADVEVNLIANIINDIINNYYNNKKLSRKVIVKKISDYCYEFGSQKFFASILNNNLRVRVLGGDFISLGKFIELYGPIEESILTKKNTNLNTNMNMNKKAMRIDTDAINSQNSKNKPKGPSPTKPK